MEGFESVAPARPEYDLKEMKRNRRKQKGIGQSVRKRSNKSKFVRVLDDQLASSPDLGTSSDGSSCCETSIVSMSLEDSDSSISQE